MFSALNALLQRWFGASASIPFATGSPVVEIAVTLENGRSLSGTLQHRLEDQNQVLPYDENLLERARLQWRLGDWGSLAAIERDTLQHHPERAKLALLVAAAHQQIDQQQAAAQFIRLARDWGCNKTLIAQILIAGVHNTLGRAAFLMDDERRVRSHFAIAVQSGAPGMGTELVARTRAMNERARIVLQQQFATSKLTTSGTMSHVHSLAVPLLPVRAAPIFIHSLWRSGSTYLFKVFRRSESGYWTYQEPIHEVILAAKAVPEMLDKFTSEHLSHLRHPQLDQSYFYELQQVQGAWRDLAEKKIILDEYFDTKPSSALATYLHALAGAAKGRPVFQECRTANRIGSIKHAIGGIHLYLWRNPWDTWWSTKVSDYFDSAFQIILGAQTRPAIIDRLVAEIGYVAFHHADFFQELQHFEQRRLSSEHSYLVFYTLWCLGLLEAKAHADLMINIDNLTTSDDYRKNVTAQLAVAGIDGLDFSDCHAPQGYFDAASEEFFTRIEDRAHTLLVASGYSAQCLDDLRQLVESNQPVRTAHNCDALARDLRHVREIVIRVETVDANSIGHYIAANNVLLAKIENLENEALKRESIQS